MGDQGGPVVGVHLERSEEHGDRIDQLADRLGGRTTVAELLGDLKFTASDSWRGRMMGRAVQRAIAFDAHDQADPVWWPQGITTSADADVTGTVAGRRVVVTTWYAKPVDGIKRGSRLTFLDLDTLRYRHVLLVDPVVDDQGRLTLSPVKIHAGGLVWAGPWLHVAATARGFVSCHVGDLMRVADDNARPDEIGVFDEDGSSRVSSFGHHYVLPVRVAHRAFTDEGHVPLRYSFLSLDRAANPPGLLAGEYGRGGQSTRLAQFELDLETWLPQTDESGLSRPVVHETGRVQMQGDVVARGRHHISVSQGPVSPGAIFTGQPGRLRRHRFATPMGPEDLTYWPATDTLWSVSEWPRRRWIYSMRRSWFD
ncbi:hypothetical protein [Nocardioides daphniae]|uniref:Uncharacterized protein n=1 Tax=Nocardioides daphniae TaxID=402297 RepID=A0A4V1CWB2_9ACTN|nr:hypothetical protein [Nocardioides daphniae]QCC76657.1 hypothetical protein E2C04_04505 [Nocardioides daphniae]GGD15119.1 hypothetical protein GCM10007231_12600 [Nocardioides daphniae]